MTRAEFSKELGGIQMMLREHQYLQYTPSGSGEYERKVRTCAEQFAYLVFRKTGVPVKALQGIVPIETIRDPSYSSGRSMAERAAKRAYALAKSAKGGNREYYAKCAALWERAWAEMSAPDKDE
jgi:hypothetical protein